MVTELVPAVIVPVSVPPSVPLPVFRLSVTPVSAATAVAVPPALRDCTITLKPVPAVGLLPPFTDVIASVVASRSSSDPSVEKVDGDPWLLYSVEIQPADRMMFELFSSSRTPVQ